MYVCVRALEREQEKRELMHHYITEDAKMRAEYRERERERAAAEEQRIAAFAREQAQRDAERRAVQSAQNEYRERMQQEVSVCYSIIIIGQLRNLFTCVK